MKDIAEIFGVSTVTVSKALGDKDGVGEKLRAEIKKKAAELGYFQSSSSKTRSIGVLVPERFFGANTFYSRFYSEISIAAADSGAFTTLEIISGSDETALNLPKLFTISDGIIFLGQFSNRYIDAVTDIGKPYVLLDFYSEKKDATCIVSDNSHDSYRMTKYLIDHGHKNIGFVGSVFETTSILDRYLGYHRALMENFLPLRTNWIIPDRKNGETLPFFALPDPLPDAFMCNCDNTAVRLIEQLKSRGIRVPKDISVVAYDDSPFAQLCEPKLTTCRVDTKKMSRTAVVSLLSRIEGAPFFCGRLLAPGEIIERDSVAFLR